RHVASSHRAGFGRRHRGLRRRRACYRRSARRRRWCAFDRARAISAGRFAQLCRLRRVAGDAGRARRSPEIHAEILSRYTFCLPEGELFLAYPVPGRNNETQVGRRAYNVVWYRPTDADTLVDLCTDASGHYHGSAIPPPLIRSEVIAGIKATARALVAPQVAEIFARAQPFFQPIFDLESPQIVFGRVALLGDAAFVARPHVGAGVTKAALDAASLADATVGEDLGKALRQYQREQQPFGRGLVALGRKEGAYISAQLKPRDQRTAAELKRDVNDVLLSHQFRSEALHDVLVASRRAGSQSWTIN